MSKSGAQRHTHKYMKLESQVWACGLPDCTHYMPSNLTAMMDGKWSICWQCNEKMILNKHLMRIDKPVCQDCELKLAGIENPTRLVSVIDKFLRDNNAEGLIDSSKNDNNDDDKDGNLI